MSRCSAATLAGAFGVLAGAAWAQPYGIGRHATPEQIAGWNIDISPDGAGLPPGHGTAREGKAIYAQQCASCHGAEGEGGSVQPGPRLAGGRGTLMTAHPVKTVGSYWPYATTLFDYIRRSMPYNAPESLSADQLYAVTAYVLFLNGLVGEDAVLDVTSLPKVRMPNRDGFRSAFQAEKRGRWR